MPLVKRLKENDSVLLDTHVMMWLFTDSSKLSTSVLELLEQARHIHGICISAISFWEIATLQRKKRLKLMEDIHQWVKRILDHSGVLVATLDVPVLLRSCELSEMAHHDDQADRIIVAQAIESEAILLTRDTILIEAAERSKDLRIFEV